MIPRGGSRAVILLTGLLAGPLGAASLIPDGTFESPAPRWHPTRPGAEVIDGLGLDGGRCLRIDTRGIEGEVNAISDEFAVDPGARYRLAARVRLLEPASQNFKVTIDWLDAERRHLLYANDWQGRAERGGWLPHGGDFQPPPAARFARILLGIQAGGLILFDDVLLTVIPPGFSILGVGTAEALPVAGRPAALRCRVVNDGGSALTGIRGTLALGELEQAIEVGDLAVGEERTVEVTATPPAAGVTSIEARLTAPGAAPDMLRRSVIVLAEDPPAGPVLRSGGLELRFRAVGDGHGAAELRRGEQLLAVVPAAAWLTVGAEAPQPVLGRLDAAGTLHWSSEAAAVTVVFAPSAHGFTWRVELTARRDLELRNLTGPELHLPGVDKQSALFCGLEYLTADEVSSAAPPLNPALMPRFVPHPNRVTVPVMAVARDGLAVGLRWDARREWAAGEDRPSAVFAAPNRLDLEDGHLMALCLPSVPDFADENERHAGRPFALAAGRSVSLEGEWFVLPAERNVAEILPLLRRRPGEPQALEPLWRASAEGRLNGFSPEGWKPEAHRDAGYHPDIALRLWNYGVWHDDAVAEHARAQVEQMLAGLPPGRLGLDLALHRGGVEANLGGLRGGAPQLDTQQPDGSWRFAPDERTRTLGEPGDTAVGTVARPLLGVLQAVRRNGDPRAWAAARRGLAYLNQMTRPAGGETWEVPLHDPNLMAAALACECNLVAYELSGEAEYLTHARYWATCGLAFVYDWQAADRPGMRGATVSVFGTTFWTHPWYGRPVQWVGLVYSLAIERLAEHDDSYPWRALAREILASAVEQQRLAAEPEAGNPLPGYFPDVYDLITGDVLPAWIGPQLLCQAAELQAGHEPTSLRLIGPPGAQIRLLCAARIGAAELDGERLSAALEYPAPRTSQAVLTCLDRPAAVRLNGRASDDWSYDDRVLIVQLPGGGPMRLEVDGARFAGPPAG